MKQIKSLNNFLAQDVLKLTSFHSFEWAKWARDKINTFFHISSSQNTCYNTYFGPKLWNSPTFPWLSWYLKFPGPSCKIPWLFPDLEEKSNFPDFSLTSGHPASGSPDILFTSLLFYTICQNARREIIQPNINKILPKVIHGISYTLWTIYTPNIMILAQAVLQILCSQGSIGLQC